MKKKYGQPRKTEIVAFDDAAVQDDSTTAEAYNVAVYITKEGYLKKIPETSLRGNAEIKVKDGVIHEFHTNSRAEILTLTDRCNAYKIYLEDVPDCKPSDLGEFMNNLNALDPGENSIFTCLMEEGRNLIIGFANGKVARIPLAAYATKQKRKKLLKAYSDLSPVLGIYLEEEMELCNESVKEKTKRAVIYKATDIPLKTTKTTQGVQAIILNKGFVYGGFGLAANFKMTKKAETACRERGFGTSGAEE